MISCDDTQKYKGKYLELQVIANNSILGVTGYESDKVFILEEDDFGRKMFCFIGSSSNGKVLSVLISQKTTKTDSYFFDGINFIMCEENDAEYTLQIDKNIVYENFTNKELEELKFNNDWGKDIDEQKLFSVKINKNKNDTISTNNQRKAFETVSDDFHGSYSNLLTTDKDGKSLYYMRGYKYDDNLQDYIFTKPYLFMFNKDGTLIDKTGIEELVDLWNYQEQLLKFKEINSWD